MFVVGPMAFGPKNTHVTTGSLGVERLSHVIAHVSFVSTVASPLDVR